MTTHEDQQLGQKIMKLVKGPMILGKEGMPQYATRGGQQLDQKVNESLLKGPMLSEKGVCSSMTTRRGQQLDRKVNETYGRFDALGEGVCPNMMTRRSQQLDQKVNAACGRPDALREEGYAPVCNDEQTDMKNASKLLYSEICSSIM